MKRTTGSSIQNLGIKRTHTLREVHGIISDAQVISRDRSAQNSLTTLCYMLIMYPSLLQGFDVEMMTFMESLDGHLHIQVQPSQEPYDVKYGKTLKYNLSRPQRQMPVRHVIFLTS